MKFQRRELWECRFFEEDLKTQLPRRVSVTDPKDMLEMAVRGGSALNLEGRQAMEIAVTAGAGGVWLSLTNAQYAKLTTS